MGEFGTQVKDTVVEKGGQLKDTVVEKGTQLKDKAMYEYDMYKAKKKYKEKFGSDKDDDEKGLMSKIKNFKKYAFGSDFTFEFDVVDNLEDMPAGMGALQLQIHEIGKMKDSLTTLTASRRVRIARSTTSRCKKSRRSGWNCSRSCPSRCGSTVRFNVKPSRTCRRKSSRTCRTT